MNIHEILLNVRGNADDAKRELKELAADLIAYGQIDADAVVGVDGVAAAQAQVAELFAALQVIDMQRVEPDIQMNIAGDLVALKLLNHELRKVDRAGSVFSGVNQGAKKFFEAISPSSVSIGSFTFALRGLGPVALIVGSALASSLVAGLVAVASTATMAVGAIGALAIAFGGFLLPALASVVGVFLSLSGAIDKNTGLTEGQAQALEQEENALRQVESAARAVADAERAVGEAKRRARFAEEELAQTRKETARQLQQDLRNAVEAQRQAELGLLAAQQDELRAQQALNDAREEAVRRLKDMKFAAEGAEIAEKRAQESLEDARARLRELQDDPFATRDEISDARLDVREAELRAREAKERSKRSEEDLQDAEQKGVSQADSVVAAREALVRAQTASAEATRDMAEAARDVAKAERAQQRPAEAIVAARRALADANRRVADSQRNLRRQQEALSLAQEEAQGASQEASEKLNGFLSRMTRLAVPLMQMVQPIVDALIASLSVLQGFMQRIAPAFRIFAQGVADSMGQFTALLQDPAFIQPFAEMVVLATQVLTPLAEATANLMRVLTNIARAAMPMLTSAVQAFADVLGRWATATSNTAAVQSALDTMKTGLEAVVELVAAFADAWLSLAGAGAEQGAEFVGWISEGLRAFADWAKSDEGRDDIQKFLEETLPLLQSFIEFLITVGGTLLQVGQLAAPAVKTVLDAFTAVVSVIGFFVGILNQIPSSIRGLAGVFLGFVGIISKLSNVGRGARIVFGLLGAVFTKLLGGIKDIASFIRDSAIGAFERLGRVGPRAWRAIKDAALDLLEWLGSIVGRFLEIGRSIVSNLVKGFGSVGVGIVGWFRARITSIFNLLRGAVPTVFNLAADLVRSLLNGLRSIAGSIVGWFRDQFNNVIDFIASLPEKFFELGKNVVEGFVDGMKDIDLKDVAKDIFTAPLDIAKSTLGIESPSKEMRILGKAVSQGFALGINDAMSEVTSAGNRMAKIAEGATRKHGARGRRPEPMLAGAGGGNLTMHNHFTVPGDQGPPDARATAAAISRRMRAKGLLRG